MKINTDSWNHIPVDDIGYINSEEFLTWDNEKVIRCVERFEHNRYTGWRNWKNLWRATLGLDTTFNKTILDFGCGYGIEALQFCKLGNQVMLSDIHQTNILAAERVLNISGYKSIPNEGKFDVFYSNGVLHHTPEIREILLKAVDRLNNEGEIRLLLYSDKAWTQKTLTPLPKIEDDVSSNLYFDKYIKAMDSVGQYADWYNQEKLQYKVGDFLKIEKFYYITENGMYATVILKPKEYHG